MQVQLKRSSGNLLAFLGFSLFMAGLASLLSGFIAYPAFQVLLDLGRWAIVVGILLILIDLGRVFFRGILPHWRKSGGRYLEVDFRYDSPLYCGEVFRCEMSILPRRTITARKWSVTLVGVHRGREQGKEHWRHILELAYSLAPDRPLSKNQASTFQCELLIPGAVRPSSEEANDKVRWFLNIDLRSSSWTRFGGTVPVRVERRV